MAYKKQLTTVLCSDISLSSRSFVSLISYGNVIAFVIANGSKIVPLFLTNY